ncbi:cytochrome P450 4F2-like isoform X3 [Branchiostoma floridae]|uniref:Cytochrome P450 4F2-like isoform X3 n=1 Tax=Branchiostoma floridae TaxID=7739 RepID=A0A9J7LTM5_BRAFL|nr:cytochrome P450 4F2-like isoform X3 [Branchiostoma floridae]
MGVGPAVVAVLAVLLTPVLYLLISFLRVVAWSRRTGKVLEQFPGPTKHWLYGNLHQYNLPEEEGLLQALEFAEKYGKVFRLWWGPVRPCLTVVHPDTAKQILRKSGDGLILSKGAQWSRDRRLLTPAFHFEVLKPYVAVYNEGADILLKKLDTCSKSGESFETFSALSLCTLDIILRCAFSYQDDIQTKGASHPYVAAIKDLMRIIFYRAVRPHLYPDFIFYLTKEGRDFKKLCAYVHQLADDIIAKRRQTLEDSKEAGKEEITESRRKLDFLDILLHAQDEDGNTLSDVEIRNQANTFMFAGHDTTASTTSWVLYSLATHPEHQERVYQEVKGILGGREPAHLEWEDLSNLKYLTLCIKEAMRLHCPVPIIGRQISAPIEVEGKVLEVGTITDVNIWNIHHNPTVWGDDHMEYDPSRFLPENMKDKDPYAFIPFSAGPRNCIGQNFAMNEEKVLISRIIHKFKLEVVPDHPVEKVAEIVMKAKDGILLKVIPRT